jgi:hypothetical protein
MVQLPLAWPLNDVRAEAPSEVPRAMLPAAMPGVATKHASPLGVMCPFSVFVGAETERRIG